MLTACNPHSRPLPAHDNQRRHQALQAAVRAHGIATLPALGQPDQPGWEAEPGLLLMDTTRDMVQMLAARFEQNAVVWVSAGSEVRLVATAA